MLQLIRCAICLITLLFVFTIWGYSVGQWFKMQIRHLPLQILCGFFSFFIVAQIIILPIIFLHNSLRYATGVLSFVCLMMTIIMLWQDKLGFWQNIRTIKATPWLFLAILVTVFVVCVSVLQQYLGYDTCYYVGQMNAFLYYGQFWTKDAFMGMAEASEIPLHYALSCFYPLFSIMAYVFHVEARLIAMYMVRALCVILFACTAYTWGYDLFVKDDGVSNRKSKYGHIFTVCCLILGLFTLSEHSSAFMMMVRGYESKGYCAAVVAPMCTYALVRLCQDVRSQSNWRFLALIAWASMPVAMSSMAIIPLAIGIVGLTLMIMHKEIWNIFWRCLACVIPNLLLMAWYVLAE